MGLGPEPPRSRWGGEQGAGQDIRLDKRKYVSYLLLHDKTPTSLVA